MRINSRAFAATSAILICRGQLLANATCQAKNRNVMGLFAIGVVLWLQAPDMISKIHSQGSQRHLCTSKSVEILQDDNSNAFTLVRLSGVSVRKGGPTRIAQDLVIYS